MIREVTFDESICCHARSYFPLPEAAQAGMVIRHEEIVQQSCHAHATCHMRCMSCQTHDACRLTLPAICAHLHPGPREAKSARKGGSVRESAKCFMRRGGARGRQKFGVGE